MTARLAAALLIAVAVPAWGQSLQACTFDTLRHTDTLDVAVAVRAYSEHDAKPDSQLTALLAAIIAPRFTPPPTIGRLFYPGTYGRWETGPIGPETTLGVLSARLGHDGTLKGAKWARNGRDAATETAVTSALETAQREGDLSLLAERLGGGDHELKLELLLPSDSLFAAPIIRLRVPLLRIDRRARVGSMSRAVFPKVAARAQVDGRVTIDFVIDESGNAIPSSARLVAAPYAEFAEASLAAILRSHFFPATIGSCPVKQRYRYSINYKLSY